MLDSITSYINDHYGSRRGLINTWLFKLQYFFGRFAQYRAVDWSRVSNLVFICHGNICRSPLAEAVAAQRHSLHAESYGLDCTDGAKADPRAVDFAAHLGVALKEHSARHVKSYTAATDDLIIVMEPRHLLQLPPALSAAQVTLIGMWLENPCPYVHDPFGSNERHFEFCESLVVSAVEGIAKRCRSKK